MEREKKRRKNEKEKNKIVTKVLQIRRQSTVKVRERNGKKRGVKLYYVQVQVPYD